MNDIERGYRAAIDVVSDRAMKVDDDVTRNVVWNVYHELVREMNAQIDKAHAEKLKSE